MGISIWHILVVVVVVLLLFGKGRISGMMEDLGKGIQGFKRGLNDDAPPAEPKKIEDREKDEQR